MKKLLSILFIVSLLLVIGCVDAKKIIADEGKYKDNGATLGVNLGAYNLSVIDESSGIGVLTGVEVNGNTKILLDDKGKKVKTMTNKVSPTPTPGGDPQVVFQYELEGNRLKETITLEADCNLSFPLTIPSGMKIIPWFGDTWKIVSATSGDTMVGLLAEKPYGIDAANKYIEMNYTWDGQNLNLNYERYAKVYNQTLSRPDNPIYDYFDIKYPLVIDPTWTSFDGHFKSVSGQEVTEMWNATGISSWSVPAGVTNVWVLAVGGGGSGMGTNGAGGGGAGGVVSNESYPVTPGTSINVSVGSGGIARPYGAALPYGTGEESVFDQIRALGGGPGGQRSGTNDAGSGGSGGGAEYTGTVGTGMQPTFALPSTGFGNAGGLTNGYSGGGTGGGGSNTTGVDNTANNNPTVGGDGKTFNITGEDIIYARGGGGSNAYTICPGAEGGGGYIGGVYQSNTLHGHGGCNQVATPVIANGEDGKGDGGGGGSYDAKNATGVLGGKGGSGVIIIKYLSPPSIGASFSTTNISVATNSTSVGWEGAPPFTMRFVNTSIGVEQTSWVWNYTKIGSTNPVTFNQSSFYDVTYTFPSPGNYSISLNATSSLASNISVQNTWVNLTSPVYWTANTTVGMIGISTIQFTDISPMDGMTYNWSFGDGTYSSSRNVSHTYISNGLYTVKLISPYPGISYLERNNYINISAPSFVCNPLSGSIPLPVSCNDTSVILTDDVLWDFGDGFSIHNSGNILHTYTTSGNYNVTLQTPFSVGSNTTYPNYIHAGLIPPVASFTSNVTEVAAGGYVQFTDTSINSPDQWNWDFTGGTESNSTLQNPIYQFNHVGNFTVNLTASNAAGNNSLVASNYIRVYPTGWYPGMQPITAADFTVTPYTYTNVNDPLNFNGTVTSGTGQWYKWDFNGGTAIDNTTITASHTYLTSGYKTVNFTAYNAISSYSVVKTNYILVVAPGAPYAQFYALQTSGTPGVLINFVDQSLKGTPSGLVYNWSFGDGIYSTTPYSSIQGNVQHVYTYAGVYDVNLSITNANGTSYQYRPQYITVAVNQQTQTTFYTPKTIQFHVTDIYGNSISGATINANFNQTTLPPGWLVSNFGMNTEAANQALNGTLIMSGITSSTGDIGFTMNSAIGYDVTISYGGNTNYYFIYPSSVLYNLKFIATTPTTSTYTDLFSGGKTGTWFTTPDTNNVTLWWSFQDLSGLTTRVDYYVIDFTTNATIFHTFQLSPGTSQYMLNWTEPNVRGAQRIWYMNITRSV